jgi:Fibronectin type III domain
MPTIKPSRALFSLSALVFAGLFLTACGNGVGVSPASATATASAVPAASPPSPPAPAPPPTSPATGSASLAWTAPTENTNGTPLTNLAGYHIYYGTSVGAWTSTITILDATETSYVVGGLAPGTYYFAVVAFNTDGDDSPQSNVGTKTI